MFLYPSARQPLSRAAAITTSIIEIAVMYYYISNIWFKNNS